MNLLPKQHLAIAELNKSWDELKKAKGWNFLSIFFNSEYREAIKNFNHAAGSIVYEPQYLDDSGKGIDRVRADYDAGSDMTHYGWDSREEYAKKMGIKS